MLTPPSLPVNIEVFHIKYTYQTVTKPKDSVLTKRRIANGFSCNWRKEFHKQRNKVFWCNMFRLAKTIKVFRSQMHFAQCTSVEECPLEFWWSKRSPLVSIQVLQNCFLHLYLVLKFLSHGIFQCVASFTVLHQCLDKIWIVLFSLLYHSLCVSSSAFNEGVA